jgi:hypothetical protein
MIYDAEQHLKAGVSVRFQVHFPVVADPVQHPAGRQLFDRGKIIEISVLEGWSINKKGRFPL